MLLKNVLFNGLDDNQIKCLIDAFEAKNIGAGETIIKQGQNCYYYYYYYDSE